MAKHTTSRRFKKLRAQFRLEGERTDARCWICRQPIDYNIPRIDPYSGKLNWEAWELDHLYPQSTHPELAEDPGNFRHSHSRCNNDRGNAAPQLRIRKPSRQWLA